MSKKIFHSNKIQFLGLLFIIFGLYISLFQIRWQIVFSLTGSQRFYLWGINLFAIVGLFLIFLTNLKTLPRKEWGILVCMSLSCIPVAISKHLLGVSFGSFVVFVVCCIFPIALILLDVDLSFFKKSMPILLLVINILFVFIVLGALLDKLCDRAMLKWLASFMTANKQFLEFVAAKGPETSRYFSILGHPLLTAFVANTFLILNILGHKYHIAYSLPHYINFPFALIIAATTASKTTIIAILLIALITFYRNFKVLLIGFLGLLAFSFTGFFNELLTRLTTGSLTSGRVTALMALLSDSRYPFHFFYGYGDPAITSDAFFAAFEFPIVLAAFNYGLLFVFLFIGVPFLYITAQFMRLKQYSLYLYWLVLFAQINTYPTLAQGYDHPWFFYFITFIMLQYAKELSVN